MMEFGFQILESSLERKIKGHQHDVTHLLFLAINKENKGP
jgi:hypothetical protein